MDEHARVTNESEASKVHEASPWAADKRAAEIVRPAPVQTADNVPPKSLARDMAFAKLRSRILSAAEAVQAAKLHSEMPPEQQAILLSAGGPATGTCWTAMHKSPTELAQNAQCRMATALRLGTTPDAPRVLCGKAVMGTCASNLWRRTLSTRSAIQHTLRRLIQQAGGYADLERHVLELYDWVEKQQRSSLRDAVRNLTCGLLVPWRPAATLDRRQRAMPLRRTLQRKCVETRGGCSCWGWKTGR